MRSHQMSPHEWLIYMLGGICMLVAVEAHAASSNDAVGAQLSNKPVMDSNGKCVRTKWMAAGDPCAPPVVVQQTTTVVAPPVWNQEQRTVYFPFNSAQLDPAAKQKIDTIAQGLKSTDQIKDAHVVGLADRIGSTSYNEQLSKRRAMVVQQYLVQQGVVQPTNVETQWLGKQESSHAQCPDSLSRQKLIDCLQPDRRVEIKIDYTTHGNANE